MPKVYRIANPDGTFSAWQFFSEKSGSIIECGESEEEAQAKADNEAPDTTIAEALEGVNGNQETETSTLPVADSAGMGVSREKEDTSASEERSEQAESAPAGTISKPAQVVAKKTSSLTPQFIKKLKANLANGTTNLSVELERFLFSRFGFTTAELEEDDCDVEMLRMGWELQFEYWLADSEPPAWLIILFGQMCITLHLIATAKKKAKKEDAKSLQG